MTETIDMADVGRAASRSRAPVLAVAVRTRVQVPLRSGALAEFITFDGFDDLAAHFAVRLGIIKPGAVPLVRMHSECITGDLFGSLRCDCGLQLEQAMEKMSAEGGILLYLRQEGRGIGLLAKMDAYRLQDQGLDTFEANRALSLPADARSYLCAAGMLKALGVGSVRLLTNNHDKVAQLRASGIEVAQRLSTDTFVNPFNANYLRAKVRETGHCLAVHAPDCATGSAPPFALAPA